MALRPQEVKKMTICLVKQLSLQERATMRDLDNVLGARSGPGLKSMHLTYWYPVPGSRDREYAFGYTTNATEPFTRYIVRWDQPAGPDRAHHDLYTPARHIDGTLPPTLSDHAVAELQRQRSVTDAFREHFCAGPSGPKGWHLTLPVVEYIHKLRVAAHLNVMPVGAIYMMLGHHLKSGAARDPSDGQYLDRLNSGVGESLD